MLKILSLPLFLLGLLLPAYAQALEIHKCPSQSKEGYILYSYTPCRGDKGESAANDKNNKLRMDELSSSETRALNMLQPYRGRSEDRGSTAPYSSQAVAGRSEAACDRAHERVEAWRERMAEGYNPAAKDYFERELRRRINDHDRVCDF